MASITPRQNFDLASPPGVRLGLPVEGMTWPLATDARPKNAMGTRRLPSSSFRSSWTDIGIVALEPHARSSPWRGVRALVRPRS
jgi:hypothetical protein